MVIEYCGAAETEKEFDYSAHGEISTRFIGVDRKKALKLYIHDLKSILSAINERKDEIPCDLPSDWLNCRLQIYSNLLKRLNLD